MGKKATARVLFTTALVSIALRAQTPADWRHIGNSLIDASLAGPASGPVDRVWYSSGGSRLLIQTASRKTFETADFENWRPSLENPPSEPAASSTVRVPETGSRVRSQGQSAPRVYAFGKFAYRSDDNGSNWENLTAFRASSILGGDLRDLAIAPANSDEIVVAGGAGVFRSLDGGRSWTGLNQGLPNLPADRLVGLPSGGRGVQLALSHQLVADSQPSGSPVVEWQPGEKQAWRVADNSAVIEQTRLRQALSLIRGTPVTAIGMAGEFVYSGMVDGRISVSSDRGVTWQSITAFNGGAVTAFWIDPNDPRVALATLGARLPSPVQGSTVHILRTVNGGSFWDDFTANLPDVSANGITADRASGAIYAATERGVYFTDSDLGSLGGAPSWKLLTGLPTAAAKDARLDAQGNQLWVSLEGYGVYSTLAPHRFRDPRVVSAADFLARAVAPGSLVSVLGARVQSASAGNLNIPVLAANDSESQIQIPFEARGDSISLTVDAAGRRSSLPALALQNTAPAIFVDRDGSPMLLDADSGVMLDAMTPAHSNARLQVLATGLGRVNPDWPTGLAAPLDNPPQVTAPVRAYLDRTPVEVTRAVLAPGYIGFYLIEIEIPKITNYGPAELYLEIDGQPSNRVRVYIEP